MKDFAYYSMNDGTEPKYPSRPPKPIMPKVMSGASAKLYSDALILWEDSKAGYDEQMKIYRDESDKRSSEFINDLFEEFGVVGNPKADKCFSIAYEMGHSSGYQEVWNYFSELVELITP